MSTHHTKYTSSIKKWFQNPLHIIFIVILFSGIFFRFYGAPTRYGFDKDPTRDALVTMYGVKEMAFPTLGPASGIAAFTFGPWYYYELIIFSFLVPLQFAPFYFISLISVLLIIVMYFLGKELWDETLGLILSVLTAFTPSLVGPASGLSNPNLVPLHAGVGILIFVLFMKRKGSMWLSFLWGIVMGIGINHHYQMMPLLLLPILYYLLHIKSTLRDIGVFIIGLVLTFLPLLYFNVVYHWYTVQGVIKFIHSGGSNNYIPNNWHIYLLDFWPKFFGYIFSLPNNAIFLVGLIVAAIYGFYFFIQKKKDVSIVLLLLTFGLLFIFLRFYNAERSYYYFLFLEPLLIIVVGFALRIVGLNSIGKGLIGIICLAFIVLSLPQDYERTKPNYDQKIARSTVNKLLEVFPSKNLSIYTCEQKAIEKALGVTVLLEGRGKLSESGQKIGFNNSLDNCRLPDVSVTALTDDIYDFHAIPDPVLNKYGWYKITPETVYKNTVLWWTPHYEKI